MRTFHLNIYDNHGIISTLLQYKILKLLLHNYKDIKFITLDYFLWFEVIILQKIWGQTKLMSSNDEMQIVSRLIHLPSQKEPPVTMF